MEKYKSEKVSFWRKPFRQLAALALAAALALGLAACDGASVLPGGSADVIPNPASSGVQTADSFRMHFLDVGQALSVLVECDGQYMLYDGGNVDDGSMVVSYLQKQGVDWSARTTDGSKLPEGVKVKVKAIAGVKLMVSPIREKED